MNWLLFATLVATQEASVREWVEKLGSERIEDRTQAEDELLRRGRNGLNALLEDYRGAAREPERRARLRAALEKLAGGAALDPARVASVRVTYETRGLTLSRVAADLESLCRLPLGVFGKPASDPALPALSFKETPLSQVLDALAASVGGLWFVDVDRLLLVPPARLPIRLFDVQDLTLAVEDEPPLSLEPRGPLYAAHPEEAWQAFTGEDLVGLIKTTVTPDGWLETDGQTIQFNNGLLIVRNGAAVLLEVEKALAALKARTFRPIRIELEAYALRGAEGGSAEEVRRLGGAGKEGVRVAAFARSVFDRRRIAVGVLGRTALVTGYDARGGPVLEDLTTGPRMNARFTAAPGGGRGKLAVESAFTRLLRVDTKRTADGGVQVPELAHCVLRKEQDVPLGSWVILGRLSETRWADGFPELVVLGRVGADK